MRWSNVRTIFRREVRDQVRDRRTLFMVFALPILLYPVLGIGVVQFYMAFEEKPREVVLLGAEYLPPIPPLLNASGDGFSPDLVRDLGFAGKLRVRREEKGSPWSNQQYRGVGIRQGQADAVLMIPPDVATRLEKDRSANIPIDYVSADERSQVTYLRIREILTRWSEEIVRGRLAKVNKTSDYVEPVRTAGTDLATKAEAGGNVWGRIFPFLLVIMALTGAFYPSIDLCAGEKERGTMETLLISPASRGEIVMGKFLTVVLASMTTAILNLLSMGLTGLQLAYKVAGGSGAAASALGPPTLMAAFWMVVLLVPLSVFFSAICVALAVLAKSMKEGQYYMTPLYMVSLPLILLTLAPGVELTPFYSMVPITGVGLLLKSLIVGDYGVARRYFIPVLVPMVIYGAVALRWAVDQFRREDVLFRESERFEIGAWLRHLIRHREATPTPSQAFFCFTLMICLAWFATQALGDLGSPLVGMGLGHLVFILLPPVLMALFFTSNPARTLRLARPDIRYVGLALGLAAGPQPVRPRAERVGRLALPAAPAGRRAYPVADEFDSECLDRAPGLRRDPLDHRGDRVPRHHPLGPRARAPDPHGDPDLGLPLRLPPRPDQPVQPALHGDAPGRRARAAGRPEPEPAAGDLLPSGEQRPGGCPRLLDGRGFGRGRLVALPRRGARPLPVADPRRVGAGLGLDVIPAGQRDPAPAETARGPRLRPPSGALVRVEGCGPRLTDTRRAAGDDLAIPGWWTYAMRVLGSRAARASGTDSSCPADPLS